MEYKTKFRIGVFLSLFAVLLGLYVWRLFRVQVVDATQAEQSAGSYTYSTRVTAARGEILDRNGNVLVSNRASYNLVINNYALFNGDDPNESLRQLVNLGRKLDISFTDHLPVTREKPYEYTTDSLSDAWSGYYKEFLNQYGWDSDIAAAQLIKLMRERFHIPNDWTEQEARDVLGLRYELDLRYYTSLPTYTLLTDVDATDLAALMELGVPGMTVESSTVREYNTTYAAHLLGRTGQIYAEEAETYEALGYSMDAYVGKEGVEKAFEKELHGTDGTRLTTVDKDGNILSQYYSVEPQAGNNVELTIDINLQMAAEEALEKLILDLRENGINQDEGKDAEGGAVVVTEVKTGQILACASYPTYNPATYNKDFNELNADKYAPMNNRALLATYPPGSTYKMVTTIAAINAGVVGRYFQVEDKGVYTYYDTYQPKCYYYTSYHQTHGVINCMQALAVSCNYYFYEVGRLTGWKPIDETAKALGLGEATGIELPEATGTRANPETKKALYEGTDQQSWVDGDTLSMSIGQSENKFTPLQLAVYTAALANRGVRYKATFLNRIISADYQELLYESRPEIASKLEISDEAYAAYTEGMRLAVTADNGTCHKVFGDYDIAVCAKTGTAQHGSGGSDHASYVCYAPADDPQIAIAIYVEKGAQGGNLGNVAKAIMDVYFAQEHNNDTVAAENKGN